MSNIYKNLEIQYDKLFRHIRIGSFKTRERYGKAFKRFMVFLAEKYRLQAMETGHQDYVAVLSLARYAGLRLPEDKTHLAMKRLQCFIAYHRKSFTDERITFHGLRHTYAHEQYEKFKREGCSDYEARKKVSELLGHHRDDVTRIYLAGGSDCPPGCNNGRAL